MFNTIYTGPNSIFYALCALGMGRRYAASLVCLFNTGAEFLFGHLG